tara:strand:+ start:4616 stop:5296 length:681 start_codon:yes stop_codon:yes gene_type:complete
MIVSIHQPQYLPWLPYFSKIASSDIFVFLDEVQFQKNGIQNRNQLKNTQGKFWLTVPVSVKLGENINEINSIDSGWRKKHIKSIENNYSRSKNFNFFSDHIKDIILNHDPSIKNLNISLIKIICQKYFGLNTKFVMQSELDVRGNGSDLILNICKTLNAQKYISGPGGKNYINGDKFLEKNILIKYMENKLPSYYPQQHVRAGFFNDLSALDFILNVSYPNEYFSI